MLCEGGVDYKIEVALACKCLVALDGPPAYEPPEPVEYASHYSCPEDEVTIRQVRERQTLKQKQQKKNRHKRINHKLKKSARPDMVQHCNSQAFESALNSVLSEASLSEGVALIGSAVAKLFHKGSLPCEPGKLERFLGGLQAGLTGEAGGPPGSSCSPVGGGTLPLSSSVPPEEQEEPASASIELAIGADQSRCFTTVRDRAGSEYEYDCRVPVTVDRCLPRDLWLTSRPAINKRTGEIDDLCHRCVAPRNNTHESPPTRVKPRRESSRSAFPLASRLPALLCLTPSQARLLATRRVARPDRLPLLVRGQHLGAAVGVLGAAEHRHSAPRSQRRLADPSVGSRHRCACDAPAGRRCPRRGCSASPRADLPPPPPPGARGGRPAGTGHGTGRGSDAGRRLGYHCAPHLHRWWCLC